jgi:hypothetical protein
VNGIVSVGLALVPAFVRLVRATTPSLSQLVVSVGQLIPTRQLIPTAS